MGLRVMSAPRFSARARRAGSTSLRITRAPPALGQHHMVLAHDTPADDDHVLAQLDVGPAHAVYAAGQRLRQAGFLVGKGIRDLEQGRCVHYDVIAQAAGAGKQPFPHRLFLGPLAHIGASGAAIVAFAAVIQQPHSYPLAFCP